MTEFEKIALLYLAHQSQCLHWLCRDSDTVQVSRPTVEAAQKQLADDIRVIATPDILVMLGAAHNG